jgi:hypothetical protein
VVKAQPGINSPPFPLFLTAHPNLSAAKRLLCAFIRPMETVLRDVRGLHSGLRLTFGAS